MAVDTCTASVSTCGSGHYTIDALVNGAAASLHVADGDLLLPVTPGEAATYLLVAAKMLRQSGVPLSQFAGRILRGEEATNVKLYALIGPGATGARSNIGLTYTNILPGTGQPTPIDFTGCTQFRVMAEAQQVGTGQLSLEIVRDSDNAALYTLDVFGAVGAGEKAVDSGWIALPAQAVGLFLVRARGKSTVAADDPVYRRVIVGAR